MSKRSTQMRVRTPPGPGTMWCQALATRHTHVVEIGTPRGTVDDPAGGATLTPGRSAGGIPDRGTDPPKVDTVDS